MRRRHHEGYHEGSRENLERADGRPQDLADLQKIERVRAEQRPAR
jgi:hypothetical protein